jgi:hypothetical protein
MKTVVVASSIINVLTTTIYDVLYRSHLIPTRIRDDLEYDLPFLNGKFRIDKRRIDSISGNTEVRYV